jgi:DNA-binding beta-propeller fold protein YncE
MKTTNTAFLIAAGMVAIAPPNGAQARKPVIGDTTVFATLPAFPGFPEQPITSGDKLYVCTDAHFGTVGQGPPEVQVFSRRDGSLLARVPLQNVDITQEHGMSAGAFDLFNRLYVLSVEQGVVRIDFNTGEQDVYAPPLPFLPMCAAVPAGTPCSPKLAPLPPLANDIAFDWDGTAYISDSFQATIFRVPSGGGAPEIWFQDPRLVQPVGGFGTNGLRMSPDDQSIYFNVTTEAATGDGLVYVLDKVARPTAANLHEFHRWSQNSGSPDDLAFGLSGRLYVSLPFQNQIAILDTVGNEITRVPGAAQSAGLSVPFDMPSGIDFDDATGSIYITNHAEFSGDATHMVVFETYVADFGWPLIRPLIF